MNLIQYRGGRYADPDFDAYAMLQPPASFRSQRTSLTQYHAANNGSDGQAVGHDALHGGPGTRPGRQPNKKNKHGNPVATKKSALAQLQADEAALLQRKSNIARFGGSWLRPPGVPKTYQAMMDEAAEREEQEAQARREAAAAEEQRAAREAQFAAQRAAGGRPRRQPGADGADGGDGAMDIDQEGEGEDMSAFEPGEQERDLDDEVPDADEIVFEDSEEEVEDEEDDDDDVDASGDGGLLEEPDDDDQMAEHGLGLDRDLDNSILSAGSYQHTDTDVEDSSSIDDHPLRRQSFNGATSAMSPLFPPQSSSLHQHNASQNQAQPQASSSTPMPTPPGVPVSNALNPPHILDAATGRFVHSIQGTADFMPVGGADMSVTSLGLEMGAAELGISPDEGSSFLLSSPAAMTARRTREAHDEYLSRRSREGF